MTDAQIVVIAITVLAVLGGTLINNVRISDSNTSLNKRIDDVKETLRAEMKLGFALMDQKFAAMNHKLDQILRIVGDHETRIATIERRGL